MNRCTCIGRCLMAVALVSVLATSTQAGGLLCQLVHEESERFAEDFKSMDSNADGKATLDEYKSAKAPYVRGLGIKGTFSALDANEDGRLSVAEFRTLPWHVVGRHAELKHCPVSIDAVPKSAETYADLINEKLLASSPPLTGKLYDRKSGLAINALLRIASYSTSGNEKGELKICKDLALAPFDLNGDKKLAKEECWRFLYTHDPQAKSNTWTIHEWGTFTSVQDERGRELAGINIDDEPVPKFVHNLSPYLLNSPLLASSHWQQRMKAAPRRHPLVTMRLETPVIYFYPPKGAALPQTIDVDVQFRGGWLTEFYPKAKAAAPGLGTTAFQFGELTSKTIGSLSWKGLKVGTDGVGPKTDAHVWTAPRKVASKPVTTPDGESEQYLFYRGVGNLRAPLRVTTDRTQKRLSIYGNFDELPVASQLAIREAWLAHILPNQEVAFRRVELDPGTSDSVKIMGDTGTTFAKTDYDKQNLVRLKQAMKTALVSDGLYEDEATAMLDTWQRAYFTSPGLRLFYLVPRDWTDHYLPLKLSRDAEIARVMMGRIELVTERQQQLLKQITSGPLPNGAWIHKIPKSEARTKFLAGRADYGDLGVKPQCSITCWSPFDCPP